MAVPADGEPHPPDRRTHFFQETAMSAENKTIEIEPDINTDAEQ